MHPAHRLKRIIWPNRRAEQGLLVVGKRAVTAKEAGRPPRSTPRSHIAARLLNNPRILHMGNRSANTIQYDDDAVSDRREILKAG
jgi:hypothetical protein